MLMDDLEAVTPAWIERARVFAMRHWRSLLALLVVLLVAVVTATLPSQPPHALDAQPVVSAQAENWNANHAAITALEARVAALETQVAAAPSTRAPKPQRSPTPPIAVEPPPGVPPIAAAEAWGVTDLDRAIDIFTTTLQEPAK